MGYEFTGDFYVLPFRAHVLFGDVPTHPTRAEFDMAVSDVEASGREPAAHWRLEAIRERRMRPGVKLEGDTLRAINRRVAKRLFELRAEDSARDSRELTARTDSQNKYAK